jgi:hypothetical protein
MVSSLVEPVLLVISLPGVEWRKVQARGSRAECIKLCPSGEGDWASAPALFPVGSNKVTDPHIDAFLCSHSDDFGGKYRVQGLWADWAELSTQTQLHRSRVQVQDERVSLASSVSVPVLTQGLHRGEFATHLHPRANLCGQQFSSLSIHKLLPGQRLGAEYRKDSLGTWATLFPPGRGCSFFFPTHELATY